MDHPQTDLSLAKTLVFLLIIISTLLQTACNSTAEDTTATITTSKSEPLALITRQELTKADRVLKPKIRIDDAEILSLINFSIDGFKGPKAVLHYQKLFLAKNFEALTNQIAELERNYKVQPTFDNELALLVAYYTFDIPYLEYSELFDLWVTQYPNSPIPYIARGIFQTSLAWKIRGANYIQDTKRYRITLMSLYFESADKDFMTALSIEPDSLIAYIYLISASKSGTTRNMHDVFYTARKYHTESQFLVTWYANNLDPLWGGTKRNWTTLTKHLEATTPRFLQLAEEIKTIIIARNYKGNKHFEKYNAEVKKLTNDITVNSALLKLSRDTNKKEQYQTYARFINEDILWRSLIPRIVHTLANSERYEECIFLANFALYRKIINRQVLTSVANCYVLQTGLSDTNLPHLEIAKKRIEQALELHPVNNKFIKSQLKTVNALIEHEVRTKKELKKGD